MNAVSLPADLEQFANQAVALGRFQNVGEVITAALRLLQRAETARAAFETSLDEAVARGEREGFLTIEESTADIDTLLDEIAHQQK
jgi:antitoxin ParD1/3/4